MSGMLKKTRLIELAGVETSQRVELLTGSDNLSEALHGSFLPPH